MINKDLDSIMEKLSMKAIRKKDIALVKAEAEKNAILREYEAYYDGAYDAIKAVKAALADNDTPEMVGGADSVP